MNDLNILVRKVEKISSLPTVFVKISELINDPTSTSSDIAHVIEVDQALTSRLLQLANSAFYGMPGKVNTISRAVTIIGFKQLQELVLAISVRDQFAQIGENSPLNMTSFWQHSIGCGVAARVLATFQGTPNPDSFFVAGFLHDLGRLVLLEHYPQKYLEVIEKAKDTDCFLHEVELEVFGFTHADVGGALIKNWQLPDFLFEAVNYHHSPEVLSKVNEYVAFIHIANIITHACQLGFSGNEFVPPLSQQIWEESKLKVSALEPVVNKVIEQYSEMVSFLVAGVK